MRTPEAFTLIEVILALAILGAALAVVGEIIQLADHNAADAQALTRAELLADSAMEELLAGTLALTNVTDQPMTTTDRAPWLLTITLSSSDVEGIVPVEVIVRQDLDEVMGPVKFRLLRWFPTPTEAPPTDDTGDGTSGPPSGGA